MRRQRNLLGPQGMGGMVSLWGASSLIKSVQRGVIFIGFGLTSNTATVTAVDLPNSRLRLVGYFLSTGDYNNVLAGRLALTDATTVTWSRNTQSGGSYPFASWELVEYMPGVIKSIQRGTVAGNSATSTITAVNTAKTETDSLGCTGTDANTNVSSLGRIVLTNTTTITGNSLGAANDTLGFQVVEFF